MKFQSIRNTLDQAFWGGMPSETLEGLSPFWKMDDDEILLWWAKIGAGATIGYDIDWSAQTAKPVLRETND